MARSTVRLRPSSSAASARTTGKVVWCLTRFDLFFPALAQIALHPDPVIFVECDKEETMLASFKEALRYGGLGAVVAKNWCACR
ncbi:UNVERIFIED_ORG: hypothetical protein GGE44_001052 [Rhizobium esperanzae]